MDRVLTRDWTEATLSDETRPRPRVAPDWPLMGDILSHRMEIPEHLLRWWRAEEVGHDSDGG